MKKKLLILFNGTLSEEEFLVQQIKQSGASSNPRVAHNTEEFCHHIKVDPPDIILVDAKTTIDSGVATGSLLQSCVHSTPCYLLVAPEEHQAFSKIFASSNFNLIDKSSLPHLLAVISNSANRQDAARVPFRTFFGNTKPIIPFLIENTSDVLFALNQERKIVFVNPAFEEQLGYKSEAVLNLPIYSLVHSEELRKAENLFGDSADTAKHGVQLQIKHKIGTWSAFIISVNKQESEEGMYLFCLAKNVVEKSSGLALHNIFHEKSLQLQEENSIYVIIDKQYRVKKYNNAAKEWFRKLNGRPLRENEKIQDIVPCDALGRLSDRLTHAFAGETVIYEKKLNVPNTGNLWFELVYTPVFDDEKNVVGVSMAFNDLSHSEASTIKDEDSEQLFKTLIQFSPDMTAIVSEEGTVQYVSTTSALEIGFGPEELKGKNLLEYIHPEDQYLFENSLGNAQFEYEQSINIEIRIKHKNSTWVYFDATIKQFWFAGHREERFLIHAQNITERKQVEDALKLHVSAIEASQNGIMIVDAMLEDYPIIYVNPRFEAVTGYEGCEIMGRNPRFLHGEDVSQPDLEKIRYAMRHGKPCTVLLKNYKKDGSLFWNELTISPISDNDGTVTHFVGTTNDISERIFSNENLNKSNAILKAISEIQSVFISESAPKDLFEHLLNRLLFLTQSQFGFIGEMIEGKDAAEQLVIRTISDERKIQSAELVCHHDAFHSNACGLLSSLCQKVIQTGKPAIENKFRMNASRTELPSSHPAVNTFVALPLMSGDNLIGIAGVSNRKGGYDQQILDYLAPFLSTCASIIAAQRQNVWRRNAEEKLREQAALLDITEEAIIVCDEDDMVLYWNNGAVKMYGWEKHEILGKNACEFLDTKDKHTVDVAKTSVLNTGHWLGELTHIAKSGKDIVVESRWNLMPPSNGGPNSKSILILNTDITSKKKFESHLLRAQRLESLGRLVSGIAHDLNNILSPILLSLQLLKRKATDDKAKGLIDTLELSAKRGGNLVKQVLSFAKGVECERLPIKIEHSVQEVEKILFETFPKTIDVDILYNKPLWYVHGDSTQLHQVLLNLCVNARDAMQVKNGGALRITVSNAVVGEREAAIYPDAQPGRYVKVSVSDTGTGIAPEHLDSIYEPFFTTKELGQGTGLGLSTVFMIVKSHQGFITVYSELGKGTTFNVFLPAFESEETEFEPTASLSQIQGIGEHILVVDDEAPVREVTKESLQANGYDVITAENGEDAISKVQEATCAISAAIIDMMMPKLDGTSTIKLLRQTNPSIKIIAVSGLFSYKKVLTESGELVDAFLQKPYTSEQLLGALHEVLHEQKTY
ncbi:PAS domain S-box protein [Chloroherpeton thalassium]|nr:PAS domain S-box protein [Chloroherpeton thalassium]